MTRFKIKGINDERDTCDCCGKTGLKKVVWIEDVDAGEIRAFGTTCALNPAKAFGLDKEIKKAVRDYDAAQKRKRMRELSAAISEACSEAGATYTGKWVEWTAPNGKVGRKPADSAAFEAHKAKFVAAAKAEFGCNF